MVCGRCARNFYEVTRLSGCLRNGIRNRMYERQNRPPTCRRFETKWLSRVLLLSLLTKPPPREARIILEPVMLVEVDCGLVTIPGAVIRKSTRLAQVDNAAALRTYRITNSAWLYYLFNWRATTSNGMSLQLSSMCSRPTGRVPS